jgi:hypothetical protein
MLTDSGRASDPSPSPLAPGSACAEMRGRRGSSPHQRGKWRSMSRQGKPRPKPGLCESKIWSASEQSGVIASAVEERSVSLHLSRLRGYVRLHCPHPLFEIHPLHESSRLLPLHLCRFHAGQHQQVNFCARQAAAYFARVSASCRPSVWVRLHRCSLHVPMVCPFLPRFNTPADRGVSVLSGAPFRRTSERVLKFTRAVLRKKSPATRAGLALAHSRCQCSDGRRIVPPSQKSFTVSSGKSVNGIRLL